MAGHAVAPGATAVARGAPAAGEDGGVLSWTVHTVQVQLAEPYPIIIGHGAMARAGGLARRHLRAGGQAFVITSPTVRRHCLAPLTACLQRAGIAARVVLMPDGEPAKTMATAARLAEELARAGADRGALIIALGGGVVGDVAGFVAAIYMRGVPVLQAPTTVVAMLDSAIGGKTGVNLRAGKNLVGAFHQPRAVIADLDLLASLPDRQYRSGLAEALKCGVIADARLFRRMQRETAELRRRAPGPLEAAVTGAAAIKARVVAADEREGGLRRILNFGHTLGHALESATRYRHFLHGEAVGWGMIAAARLAAKCGRLPGAEAKRIEHATLALLAPLPPIRVAAAPVLRHARRDKKNAGGVLHFVLPTGIGRVEVLAGPPPEAVREALEETMALSRSGEASGRARRR